MQQLGFSEKEIEVYLALLRSGKANPTDVANVTRINRTTVYSVTKSLLEKGAVSEDIGGKTLYLVPTPPEHLLQALAEEQAALDSRKVLAESVIKELARIPSSTQYSIPRIRFIEEGDLEQHLYKQSLVWVENNTKFDCIWWGFQDHTFVEVYREWLEWIWKEYGKQIAVNLLSNQSQIESELQGRISPNRHIAFWDKAEQFTATTWIIGDYLIMIMTRQHPFYLMEIHDPVLAHNQREVFRGIWTGLK